MPGLKLNHVSKRGPWSFTKTLFYFQSNTVAIFVNKLIQEGLNTRWIIVAA